MVIHRRRSAELGQASQTDSLRPVSVGRALRRLACLAIGTGDRPTENRHRTVPETIPAPADDPIRCTPAAARRLSAKAETTRTDLIGSTFLGRSVSILAGLARPLRYVQADTVVRWQRERFRKFWARRSKADRRRGGRPATVEIRRLRRRPA